MTTISTTKFPFIVHCLENRRSFLPFPTKYTAALETVEILPTTDGEWAFQVSGNFSAGVYLG